MFAIVRNLLGALWYWRSMAFPTAQMDEEFYKRRANYATQLTDWWCGLNVFFAIVNGTFRQFKYHNVAVTVIQFLPLLPVLGAFIVKSWCPPLRRHMEKILCFACMLIVGWAAYNIHLLMCMDMSLVHNEKLADVWKELERNQEAKQRLEWYLTREITRKHLWAGIVVNFLYLGVLQFLGLTWTTALLNALTPLLFAVAVFTSPCTSCEVTEALTLSAIISIYNIFSSYQMSQLQRREFHLDHTLKESLGKEARALQEMAHQEHLHKDLSQQADTILNHILKNTMADAAGCVNLFLESYTGACSAELTQAITCLDRGMQWCHRRHAILRISSAQYTTQLSSVNLNDFGRGLVRGRPVTCQFPDVIVLLDTVLCDIVLDNALNNAFRHGRAEEPDVHFSMRLNRLAGSACMAQLVLLVTNRAHPDRPKVTPELVNRILAGEAGHDSAAALSENLGLQHLFMAAKAHGMTLTLNQDGDVVALQAVVEVQVAPEPDIPGQKSPGSRVDDLDFPAGLRIACIDDSDVAQRLLKHFLTKHANGALVEVFGATKPDVEAFIGAAMQGAHIAILDQHLDCPTNSVLGTQLISRLVTLGYRGFLCIRSANVAEEDRKTYFQSGAHCVLSKDINVLNMVARLKEEYMRFVAPPEGSMPGRTCSLIADSSCYSPLRGAPASEGPSNPHRARSHTAEEIGPGSPLPQPPTLPLRPRAVAW